MHLSCNTDGGSGPAGENHALLATVIKLAGECPLRCTTQCESPDGT